MEKERNLASNHVIVVVNCSVCCTVEQKCSASLFLFAQCQFAAFAFGAKLDTQSLYVPWTSCPVPPCPALVLCLISLKKKIHYFITWFYLLSGTSPAD